MVLFFQSLISMSFNKLTHKKGTRKICCVAFVLIFFCFLYFGGIKMAWYGQSVTKENDCATPQNIFHHLLWWWLPHQSSSTMIARFGWFLHDLQLCKTSISSRYKRVMVGKANVLLYVHASSWTQHIICEVTFFLVTNAFPQTFNTPHFV